MMNTSKKPAYNVTPGTIIKGKWHHKSYTIIKSLGYGATGSVYLAEGQEGLVALKISNDSMAITSEVNVLRHFSKVQGCLGPSLLDVDDWLQPGSSNILHFYIMEYLKGADFLTYIKNHGDEWLSVIVLQLLSDLDKLHQEGWVFGDLKPDNLLVVGPPPRVRWLDVGGTTLQGRSIKEFTEFFDRGYWGLGSRKAEPSYDLFAVAMIIINTAYPNRFSKKGQIGNYLPQLVKTVQTTPSLKRYENIIIKALQGRYQSALEMRNDFIEELSLRRSNTRTADYSVKSRPKPETVSYQNKSVNKNKREANRKIQRKKRFRGVIETIIIALFLIIAYFLYIAGHML